MRDFLSSIRKADQILYLDVLVLVQHLVVEPALDKEDCQEEDEEDTPRHRQHVDQGLLHLQVPQPPQVPDVSHELGKKLQRELSDKIPKPVSVRYIANLCVFN